MMADQRNQSEPYIIVTAEEAGIGITTSNESDPMFSQWGQQSSAKWPDQIGFGVRKLREVYPNQSVLGFRFLDVIAFSGDSAYPVSPPEMVSELTFRAYARENGKSVGVLVDAVRFGAFHVTWQARSFVLYAVKYPFGFGETTAQFLVHDGPEEHIRALLTAAGSWSNDLHNEIYVFDGGWWAKDRGLWSEVQKADWDDVILDDEFKEQLKTDVYGFFDSRELYKSLSIPWKRGIIMYGSPGNGKTISLKVIMKECDAKGYYPLYVRSFRSFKGEEGAMVDIFQKAREVSPCVMILEDLDSLINDRNRSFFLNQIDGLDNNDGLLIIVTTNHLEGIDPALKSRPSRFDRKFEFVNPTPAERKSYVQYWQGKLKSNKSIAFPNELVDEIANETDKFSFAYLKEVFVSSLVLLAGYKEKDRPSFTSVIRGQIKALKGQLGKSSEGKRPSLPLPDVLDPQMHNPCHASGGLSPTHPWVTQPRVWDAGAISARTTQLALMDAYQSRPSQFNYQL